MSEDQSWVFDSLVCFLHGPIWNAPIQNFIEEKSIIFDPNETHDEKNKDYKKLHEEYKNLVDFMLGSFMDELQITPEQFEVACLEGRNVSSNQSSSSNEHGSFSFHQGLFQQIWAANDIRIFIKMMVQRNLEIQLQALDLIERRQATAFSGQNPEVLAEVIAIADDVPNEGLFNDGKLPEDIQLSPENEVVLSTMELIEKKLQEGNYSEREEVKLEEDKIFVPSEEPLKVTETDMLPIDIKTNQVEETNPVEELKSEPDINDKFKRLNLFFENDRIDSEEIKQRQEYLRAQRDKILEIKKQARARQLNETVKKTGRPHSASAQAARKLLDGSDSDAIGETVSEASMQLRKTLAKRLRAEIVDATEQ